MQRDIPSSIESIQILHVIVIGRGEAVDEALMSTDFAPWWQAFETKMRTNNRLEYQIIYYTTYQLVPIRNDGYELVFKTEMRWADGGFQQHRLAYEANHKPQTTNEESEDAEH